jgi:HEAT repeats
MFVKAILIALLTSLQGSPDSHRVSELLTIPPAPRSAVISIVLPDANPSSAGPAKKQYSVSELVEGAQRISEEDGFIKNIEKLETLVDLDWGRAEPILHQYLDGGSSRIAAFSLAKLYLHELRAGDSAQAERHRMRLKAIVENKRAPGRARDFAAKALLSTEWPDRDRWYSSLFEDRTLRDLMDGSLLMNPLITPVVREPDRWIPLLAKFVSSPNRVVHDMAVTCLVAFNLGNARSDALVLLLPWLHDPKWSSARDRLRLIQSLSDLNVRESIPGLIAVLDQDEPYERAYAAEALAHFKDSRAVPALKRALTKETNSHRRGLILKALQANGGITADESAIALEALAIERSSPEGRERVEDHMYSLSSKPIDLRISLGLFLINGPAPSSDTFARSVDRLHRLERVRPAAARVLETILDRWSDPIIDRDFLDRLEHGTATATAIASAVRKRMSLAGAFSEELRTLASGSGLAAGIASSLLSDLRSGENILDGTDVEAQAAFLACSRLARDSVSLESVARLLESDDPLLREASERYLEVEDSARARRLVLSRHLGKAHILGERPVGDPGHTSFASLDALEKQARDRILADNGPDEILALFSAGYWGNIGQVLVLVHDPTAVLIVDSKDGRRAQRELTAQELADLRQFLETNKIEDLGPFESNSADGIQLEFVRLTRNGGRRIFMNNPQIAPNNIYWRLYNTFSGLVEAPGLREK